MATITARHRKTGGPLARKIFAVTMCLLQFIIPYRIDACTEGKESSLGYGDVVVNIPDGWSIDSGTTYIELVTYLVKRPKSTETALRIILSASTTHEDLGAGAGPYCANGLLGMTVIKDGMQTIRLDIPPPKEVRPYDSKAIFVFRSSDLDAARVVATVHVKGERRSCPT